MGDAFSVPFILSCIPSDQLIPRENIQELVKVQEKFKKEEQDIKDHLSSLYDKSGKLKDGTGSQCLQCSANELSKTFNIQKRVQKKKKRERREENKKRIFSIISQLLSVNGGTPVQEVNVDALISIYL